MMGYATPASAFTGTPRDSAAAQCYGLSDRLLTCSRVRAVSFSGWVRARATRSISSRVRVQNSPSLRESHLRIVRSDLIDESTNSGVGISILDGLERVHGYFPGPLAGNRGNKL